MERQSSSRGPFEPAERHSVKTSKKFAIIPEFSKNVCTGQIRLSKLQHQAEMLTRCLLEVRAQGFERATYEQVLQQMKADSPAAYLEIVPDMFTFTGRRVIPNEKAFFSWYEGTPEGKAYKERTMALAPDMYGRLAYFDNK